MGGRQKFRRTKAAVGLLAMLLIPLFLLVYLRGHFIVAQLPIGEVFPPMEFFTQEGDLVRSDSMSGRKTALIFFTVECPNCPDRWRTNTSCLLLVRSAHEFHV